MKLSLQNSLVDLEQLAASPSRQDGIDATLEHQLRVYACDLIQTAGILLKLCA